MKKYLLILLMSTITAISYASDTNYTVSVDFQDFPAEYNLEACPVDSNDQIGGTGFTECGSSVQYSGTSTDKNDTSATALEPGFEIDDKSYIGGIVVDQIINNTCTFDDTIGFLPDKNEQRRGYYLFSIPRDQVGSTITYNFTVQYEGEDSSTSTFHVDLSCYPTY